MQTAMCYVIMCHCTDLTRSGTFVASPPMLLRNGSGKGSAVIGLTRQFPYLLDCYRCVTENVRFDASASFLFCTINIHD